MQNLKFSGLKNENISKIGRIAEEISEGKLNDLERDKFA